MSSSDGRAHAHKHVHTHTSLHTHARALARTRTRTHARARARAHTHTHTQYSIQINTFTSTHGHKGITILRSLSEDSGLRRVRGPARRGLCCVECGEGIRVKRQSHKSAGCHGRHCTVPRAVQGPQPSAETATRRLCCDGVPPQLSRSLLRRHAVRACRPRGLAARKAAPRGNAGLFAGRGDRREAHGATAVQACSQSAVRTAHAPVALTRDEGQAVSLPCFHVCLVFDSGGGHGCARGDLLSERE